MLRQPPKARRARRGERTVQEGAASQAPSAIVLVLVSPFWRYPQRLPSSEGQRRYFAELGLVLPVPDLFVDPTCAGSGRAFTGALAGLPGVALGSEAVACPATVRA